MAYLSRHLRTNAEDLMMLTLTLLCESFHQNLTVCGKHCCETETWHQESGQRMKSNEKTFCVSPDNSSWSCHQRWRRRLKTHVSPRLQKLQETLFGCETLIIRIHCNWGVKDRDISCPPWKQQLKQFSFDDHLGCPFLSANVLCLCHLLRQSFWSSLSFTSHQSSLFYVWVICLCFMSLLFCLCLPSCLGFREFSNNVLGDGRVAWVMMVNTLHIK